MPSSASRIRSRGSLPAASSGRTSRVASGPDECSGALPQRRLALGELPLEQHALNQGDEERRGAAGIDRLAHLPLPLGLANQLGDEAPLHRDQVRERPVVRSALPLRHLVKQQSGHPGISLHVAEQAASEELEGLQRRLLPRQRLGGESLELAARVAHHRLEDRLTGSEVTEQRRLAHADLARDLAGGDAVDGRSGEQRQGGLDHLVTALTRSKAARHAGPLVIK
jgi:hypothetical protein